MKQIEFEGRREKYPEPIEVSIKLDELIVYEKLKLYCTELSYRLITNERRLDHILDDFWFMGDVIKLANSSDNEGILIFNQLRLYLEADYEEDMAEIGNDDLENMVILTKKLTKVLGLDDCLKVHSLVSNLAIKRINEGNLECSKSFIRANSEILNIIHKKNYPLPPGMYKNIITVALNIDEDLFFTKINIYELLLTYQDKLATNKFGWCLQFAEHYKDRLGKSKDYYYHYCMGFIKYQSGLYLEAHNHLNELKRVRVMFLNLSAKTLHLKILYDAYIYQKDTKINSIKNIEKILGSFRKMLEDEERKQQLNYQEQHYISFLKSYRELYNFQKSFDGIYGKDTEKENERFKLRDEFGKLHHHFRNWLLKKLEEIG